MSKKNKSKSIENPDVWKNLTPPGKLEASRTVIIDLENKIHAGPADVMDKHFPKEVPITARFSTMEEYLTKTTNQTKLAYHEEFIGKIPKDRDITEIGYMTWAHFVKNCTPHIPDHTAEGNKERKSTIGTRIYTLLPDPGTGIKTPQAQACYTIFRDAVNPEKKTISEDQLKRAVEARASELKTRQDPWRIFQYYRPVLIRDKYLKHN